MNDCRSKLHSKDLHFVFHLCLVTVSLVVLQQTIKLRFYLVYGGKQSSVEVLTSLNSYT